MAKCTFLINIGRLDLPALGLEKAPQAGETVDLSEEATKLAISRGWVAGDLQPVVKPAAKKAADK